MKILEALVKKNYPLLCIHDIPTAGKLHMHTEWRKPLAHVWESQGGPSQIWMCPEEQKHWMSMSYHTVLFIYHLLIMKGKEINALFSA